MRIHFLDSLLIATPANKNELEMEFQMPVSFIIPENSKNLLSEKAPFVTKIDTYAAAFGEAPSLRIKLVHISEALTHENSLFWTPNQAKCAKPRFPCQNRTSSRKKK